MAYTKEDFLRLDQIYIFTESTLATFAFSLNTIVIYLYLRFNTKIKQKLSNVIFFIQSIADLVVCLALTLGATTKQTRQNTPKGLLITWIFFLEYSQSLTISTLFIISIERYLAIRFPFLHRSYITITKGIMVALVTFITSSVPAFVSVFYILPHQVNGERKEAEKLQMRYHITMGTLTLLITLFIFMVLYASYKSIRSSIDMRIKHHLAANFNQHAKIDSEKRKERRVIKILFSMCFVYTLTYIPFALVKICYGSFAKNGVPLYIGEIIARSSAFLYYTSACTDPLITLFFKEDYFNELYTYYVVLMKRLRHGMPRKKSLVSQTSTNLYAITDSIL